MKRLFKTFPIRNFDQDIPINPHPGGFGTERKFHIHEGVDLYCEENTPVLSIENGIIIDILPFTGQFAGSPWWEETHCVMVLGDSGLINYGEIRPVNYLYPGLKVEQGSTIGFIKRVLKKDKGRPMSMLHFELYNDLVKEPVEWKLGEKIPKNLLDPTNLLLRIKSNEKI